LWGGIAPVTTGTLPPPRADPRVDVGDAHLRNARVFAADFAPGATDGVRCDVDGNVWCPTGWADLVDDGVRCYVPNGELIGEMHLPEGCANLCFGGKKKDRCSCAPALRSMRGTSMRRGR
jgi:gluconolactonase